MGLSSQMPSQCQPPAGTTLLPPWPGAALAAAFLLRPWLPGAAPV